KSKSKKKKKKSTSTKPALEGDAFGEQMNQVDALTGAPGGSSLSYYQNREDHGAADDGDRLSPASRTQKVPSTFSRLLALVT
uniref:hypothetical protein n=1 Tax=Oceanobacillus saliphilus TaxID=2925834 RepID=UPI00201E327E